MTFRNERRSTRIRHRQMYDRYKELVAADREKFDSPPRMIYESHYYYQLSDEFGYDTKYLSRIINRFKREE